MPELDSMDRRILRELQRDGSIRNDVLAERVGLSPSPTLRRVRALEEAGYVAIEKKFVQRKPQTLYRMTEAGREALTEYVRALKQLLGGAIGAD